MRPLRNEAEQKFAGPKKGARLSKKFLTIRFLFA